MQKLSGKLKNTPRNVQLLQVPCSVNSQLNRVEKLSVENKVRTCNNPDGVLSQHTGRLKVIVYVLSKRKSFNVLRGFPLTVKIRLVSSSQQVERFSRERIYKIINKNIVK